MTEVATIRPEEGRSNFKIFTRAASHVLDPISGQHYDLIGNDISLHEINQSLSLTVINYFTLI